MTKRSLESRTQRISNNLTKQNQKLGPYSVPNQSTTASNVQSLAYKVQRPVFRVQRPESRVQRPASRIQRPQSSVEFSRKSKNSGMTSY